MRFQTDGLTLTETSITDRFGTIGLDDLPDPQPRNETRLADSATPIMRRLWAIALADVESNIVSGETGRYFGAGTGFGVRVYTRDICLSGVLGLNRLYPWLMRDSIVHTRRLRAELGFLVPVDYVLDEIDVPWQVTELGDGPGSRKFMETYRTNNYVRRTDDVVWLWAAAELVELLDDPDYAAWVYETGCEFFRRFYDPFHDESTGLYRGQACFIDIAFPGKHASGYPMDAGIAETALVRATSTNCLYVIGMNAQASLAGTLGKAGEAEAWRERASGLAEAIRVHLLDDAGRPIYYLSRSGEPSDRREALGSALTVLSGVLTGDAACRAVDYPVTPIGVPLIHPFYDDDRMYHNNSSWPFVDALFLWAAEQATGVDRKGELVALLGRTTAPDGTFHELVDMRTGTVCGSSRQLWTAAGYINVCLRAGLVDEIRPMA